MDVGVEVGVVESGEAEHDVAEAAGLARDFEQLRLDFLERRKGKDPKVDRPPFELAANLFVYAPVGWIDPQRIGILIPNRFPHGPVWYRASFHVPPQWEGSRLAVLVGKVDDASKRAFRRVRFFWRRRGLPVF